jgi:hypothetical protein
MDAPAWLLHLVCSPRSSPHIGLREGYRNDGLARIAGRLRRRGKSLEQITSHLLAQNTQLCNPPLPQPEVKNVAKSISRYPVGGPDVLDEAWKTVCLENHTSNEAKLLAIICHLALMLPGQPIALPLERIASHIGCHWTLIRRYRQRAAKNGIIREVEPYIAHKRAAIFEVLAP